MQMVRRFFGHRRLLLGIGAGGIFLAGLLAGMIASGGIPAFAAGSPSGSSPSANGNSKYCQAYLSTLANELHVTQQQLAQDNQAAIEKTLDQMQADGTITAAQKAKIEQRLQNASQHPCALLGRGLKGRHGGPGGPGGPGGHLGTQLAGARQQIEAAVAPALKLSAETLDSDLAAGQTIAQIAKAQGVSLNAVNTAYLNAVQAALKTAVSNGALTQAQSTALYGKLQQAVTAGHYPLLERPADHPSGMPPTAGQGQ